jgi:hypothetical protein
MPSKPRSKTYDVSHAPVAAHGYALADDELEAMLKTHVAPIIRDDEGTADVRAMLVGVTETDFTTNALTAALQSPEPPKDWQIGEALAEAFLNVDAVCIFPWPTARDLRDLKASLPGTDLVGFQAVDDKDRPFRFAFGEVKTSYDPDVPPNVMYGRHGLKAQLEDLRNVKATRDTLFRYLAFRAKGASWEATFRHAAARYLNDAGDVALFGVLVRDTSPDGGDLRARATALADGCPAATVIGLFAIYLPAQAIKTLVQRIEKINQEARHANN